LPTAYLIYSEAIFVVLDGHAITVRHVASETLRHKRGMWHRIEILSTDPDKKIPKAYLRPRNWRAAYPGSRSIVTACGYKFIGAVSDAGLFLPPEVTEI